MRATEIEGARGRIRILGSGPGWDDGDRHGER
jgi:hypothetical protein